MDNKAQMERPPTISEIIYQYIKKAVLAGELRAKQRIIEKEIAELFKVSQTPVREAIRKLSGEKYLIINARKEIIVAGASWKEVQELYEVVGFLDFPAVLKAMETLDAKALDELKRITNKLEPLLTMEQSDQYMDLTMKIHDRVWLACGNKFLYQTLTQLVEKIKFFCRQGLSPYPEYPAMMRSHEDHCHLITAIEKKDIPRIKEIIDRHWTLPY